MLEGASNALLDVPNTLRYPMRQPSKYVERIHVDAFGSAERTHIESYGKDERHTVACIDACHARSIDRTATVGERARSGCDAGWRHHCRTCVVNEVYGVREREKEHLARRSTYDLVGDQHCDHPKLIQPPGMRSSSDERRG